MTAPSPNSNSRQSISFVVHFEDARPVAHRPWMISALGRRDCCSEQIITAQNVRKPGRNLPSRITAEETRGACVTFDQFAMTSL